MGANMTPTMKKSGNTVFGVRMGLDRAVKSWAARTPPSRPVRGHSLPGL